MATCSPVPLVMVVCQAWELDSNYREEAKCEKEKQQGGSPGAMGQSFHLLEHWVV